MWAHSPSRIFLVGLIGFMVGVGIHSFFDPYEHGWPVGFAILGLACFALLLFWFHRPYARIIFLGLFMAVVGIARFDAVIPYGTEDEIGFYVGKKISLVGVVRAEPALKISHVEYEVATADPGRGRVLVRTPLTTSWQYGDQIRFVCMLQTPPRFSDFDYARFLARRGIFALCANPKDVEILAKGAGNAIVGRLLRVKDGLVSALASVLPEPQLGLARGILFGDRTLSGTVAQDFQITGVSHIVAASGYNIGIVSRGLLMVLLSIKFMNYRRAGALLIIGIICYALLAGAGSAVVRAASMGILVVLASYLGRASRMTNVMVFAAALMLAVNPRLLAFDVGFLLSFAATAGIVFVSPMLRARYRRIIPQTNFWRVASGLLFDTISAITLTLPIILWEFGTLSLLALPANLLIVFVVPFAMLASFALGIVALVLLPLAHTLVYVAWIPLTYMINAAHLFATIPFAAVQTGEWSRIFAILAAFGVIFWIRKIKKPATQAIEPAKEITDWQVEIV